MDGQIRTQFLGDPSGQLAAEAKLRESQKTLRDGFKEWAAAGKQAGQSIDEMLGGVDVKALRFRESQQKMIQGWKELGELGRSSIQSISQQTAAWERNNDAFTQGLGRLKAITSELREQQAIAERWRGLGRAAFEQGVFRDQTLRGDANNLPTAGWRDMVRGVIDRRGASGGDHASTTTIRENASFMRSWEQSAASLVGSYVGLHTAISMVNRAMEEQTRRAEQVISKAEEVAKAQAKTFYNTGYSAAATKEADTEIKAMALRYGVDQSIVFNTYSAALSRTGNDKAAALRVTDQATRGTRRNPETGIEVVGGIQNLRLGDPTLTEEEGLAGLSSVGKVAPLVSDAFVAEYLAPLGVTGSLYAEKGREREGMVQMIALGATLAQYKGDQEGRMSQTNSNILAEDLRDFFKEHPELKDPKLTGDRLRALSKMDLATRQGFVNSMRGDSAMNPVKELLVMGDAAQTQAGESAWGFYEKAKSEISFDPEQLKDVDEFLTKGTTEIAIADRTAKQAEKDRQAAMTPERRREVLLEDMRKAHKRAKDQAKAEGRWDINEYTEYLSTPFNMLNRGVQTDDSYAATLELEARAVGQAPDFWSLGLSGTNNKNTQRIANEAGNEIAEFRKELRELNQSIRENSQATTDNTSATTGEESGYLGPGAIKSDQKARKARP